MSRRLFCPDMLFFCTFVSDREITARNMKPKGCSYAKRVIEVNAIYDEYVKSGLSNREIWRRFIYPIYGISENTFYNYINAAATPKIQERKDDQQLTLFG